MVSSIQLQCSQITLNSQRSAPLSNARVPVLPPQPPPCQGQGAATAVIVHGDTMVVPVLALSAPLPPVLHAYVQVDCWAGSHTSCRL